jgi:PAS domain S-box-containing protein
MLETIITAILSSTITLLIIYIVYRYSKRNYRSVLSIQKELELSEEKYRSFILQSGLGIALATTDGKIIEWNPKMSEYTGISKNDALGLYIWEIEYKMLPLGLQTPQKFEKRKIISMDYLNRLPNAPVVSIETEITKDNIIKNLSITLFPIHTSAETLIGQIVKDISENKLYEKELKLYQEELEQLVIKRTGELMQATRDYSEIFDYTSDAIFLLEKREDNLLMLISTNPTAKKIFELIGEELLIDTHSESNKHGILGEILRRNCKECNADISQYEPIDKIESNNKVSYFQTLFVPIKNEQGQTYRIAGFTRDVTARYQARAEQELNSILFNTMQNVAMVVDPTGLIVRFNSECEKITGFNADEVIGKEYWGILYPIKYRFENKKRFVTMKQNKHPLVWQDTWFTANEEKKQLLCRHSWLINDVGEQKYLVISGIDITDRLSMENAIRESEEKYKEIFNNSLDGIAILNLNMDFIEANPRIVLKIGYSKEDLLHMKASDLIVPTDFDELQRRFAGIMRGNELEFYETIVKTKQGNLMPIELNSKLIDYNGAPALLTFIRDISYRKELENKLMEVVVETEQKERRSLAGDLHDEIGPLLASLRMYISTLSKKLENSEYISTLGIVEKLIKEAVDRTREISNNLSPHILESFGLDPAIRHEIENTKLILPITMESNIHNIRFDTKLETEFYRVAKELINNTKKYAKATNAYITLSYLDNILKMNYSDNGQGFDYKKYQHSTQKGIGLLNINSRIRTINGISTIKTEPGKGFSFELYCVAKSL